MVICNFNFLQAQPTRHHLRPFGTMAHLQLFSIHTHQWGLKEKKERERELAGDGVVAKRRNNDFERERLYVLQKKRGGTRTRGGFIPRTPFPCMIHIYHFTLWYATHTVVSEDIIYRVNIPNCVGTTGEEILTYTHIEALRGANVHEEKRTGWLYALRSTLNEPNRAQPNSTL